jgi:hypothetical protein
MSVCCEVSPEHGAIWSMTKEKRRFDLQRCGGGAGCEQCTGVYAADAVGAESYMIVKARSGDVWETAIAVLSADAVNVAAGQLVPGLVACMELGGVDARDEIVACFEAVHCGAFSGGSGGCPCGWNRVCDGCASCGVNMFIWIEFFKGAGGGMEGTPWFTGFTCGAGESFVGRREWLSCTNFGWSEGGEAEGREAR